MIRHPWECPCGALNRAIDDECAACAEPRPAKGREPGQATSKARPQERELCDCGAKLLASGLCSRTGGYPGTSPVSVLGVACPHCRGPLDWDGGCNRCHGCTTGRKEDWTFPGDKYELQKGHWQRVEGPRRACTPEENAAGFAKLYDVLGVHLWPSRATRLGLPAIDPAIRAAVEPIRATVIQPPRKALPEPEESM